MVARPVFILFVLGVSCRVFRPRRPPVRRGFDDVRERGPRSRSGKDILCEL